MSYKFICKKCNETHDIDMRLSEYSPSGHYCPICEEELERDMSDISGGAIWKCSGAYGKSK